MIEILVFIGLVAAALLVGVAVAFMLHQRRQGTVRAVLMPRRGPDDSPRDL